MMIMLTFAPAKHTSPTDCLLKIAVNVVGKRWVVSLQLCEMETSKDVLRVKLFVRRYRECKEIWEPKIGQEAMLMRESQNKWDSNAVTVVGGDLSDKMARKQEFSNTEQLEHPNEFDSGHEEVVGHLPKLMALHVTKLVKRPTNSGKVTVTGKPVSKYQSGFRPIHSILTTVIYMTDNCYYNIEDGLTNATLFLLIMRSSCQNWSCMGFLRCLNLFRDYLSVRSQVTVINHVNFETSFIRCGVSQAQSSPPCYSYCTLKSFQTVTFHQM